MTTIFLDERTPAAVQLGFGSLGLRGDLGYEGKQVLVNGLKAAHGISAHAPSIVEFDLDGSFRSFHCKVALNDDSIATLADFVVLADGRMVAVAPAVAPGQPRELVANIDGATKLVLRVDTNRYEHCHSVWLEPYVSPLPATRGEGQGEGPLFMTDPLHRLRLTSRPAIPRTERCITTVASTGYASMLDDLFTSIRRNGRVDDALLAVFMVDDDADCRRVIEKHDAVRIDCQPIAPVNSQVKSVLYSAAHVIPAERFLCLDVDILVSGDLRPIFSAIAAAPPRAILVCRDAYLPQRLADALTTFYGGSPRDFDRLLGATLGEEKFDLVVNDGVFAAHRDALLALDAFLRDLRPAVAWMDEPRQNKGRNQFLFNLALARMGSAVELDPTCNLQLHMRDVRVERGERAAEALWSGRPVRILHFCGWGRHKHGVLREHFAV